MGRVRVVRVATEHQIEVGGRRVDYRVVWSQAARRLRLRVGPGGVEVVQPRGRSGEDVAAFLGRNYAWIEDQLRRVARLRGVRRQEQRRVGEILFRGKPTAVRVEASRTRATWNMVEFNDAGIVVQRGALSRTPAARSLENWFRKQARMAIKERLAIVSGQLRVHPGRVYVMGQRTKWGNCSAQRNLSFNWRLILAPEFVLRYIVTHEAVHLAVPDHSAKFWLTVQSLCPEAERAKQWLSRHGAEIVTSPQGILAT